MKTVMSRYAHKYIIYATALTHVYGCNAKRIYEQHTSNNSILTRHAHLQEIQQQITAS